jgi:hypothetical protein
MHGPSGLAIVTGLAALGLSYVVWTWDTRPLQPLPQLASMPKESAPDLGGAIQLHSAAWRTLPAVPAEEAATQSEPPPSVQAAAPALNMQFSGTLLSTTTTPMGLVANRTTRTILEPVATPLQAPAPATSESEPPAPLPAAADTQSAAITSPNSQGRMALAGPGAAEAPEPAPPHANHQTRPVPDRATEVSTPPPTENKFGPSVFKGFERNGF